MNINRASRDFNAKELYLMTMSAGIGKMTNNIGKRVDIADWLLYEDVNHAGNTQQLLAVKKTDGDVVVTNSPSFIKEFIKLQDVFAEVGETVSAVTVVSGRSKAGREFITCVYAD
jgi:hypothetical protein